MPNSRSGIPAASCEITERVKKRQADMFRLAERDHGLTLAVLHAETRIPLGTLRGWKDGVSIMPIDGLGKLATVIPNELVSLVIDWAGKSIVDAQTGDTAMHDLALQCAKFLAAFIPATHPDSPGQERIVHTEMPDIQLSAEALADRLRLVA